MLHYHGLPITPAGQLNRLTGRCFCVSYAVRRQIEKAHEIGQSVMIDNGAFSFWKGACAMPEGGWNGFANWAEPWLDHPTTWAVIPDVIDGSESENDDLIRQWRLPRGAPVWHMHERIDRLRSLVDSFERVCIGSSGMYREIGTVQWHHRMEQAMNAVCAGQTPWLHMLRGMRLSGSRYPFASVDSTAVARNHAGNHTRATPPKDIVKEVERWDSMQCPARWQFQEQMDLLTEGASV